MTRRLAWAVLALTLMTGCASAPRSGDSGPPPTLPPTPSPTPTPPAAEEVPPALPTPVAAPSSHIDPPLIRVLLDRTGETVLLDQPGRPYRAAWTGGESWLFGPVRLAAKPDRWWQVAALSDEDTARSAAAALSRRLGHGVETSLTRTQTGLVRLRVRWTESEPGDAKAVLAAAGYADAFVVPGGGRLRVESAGAAPKEVSGELVLEPHGDWPVAVKGSRYHGRIRIRASAGELLVINELTLESYLKGVVPAEMGPFQFPQLDALKAQTIAARTYAVAHLGDHDEEGYDICDTPACQVYRGADAQHSLTDRAVDETAGMIAVFDGEPIDAMYTSTCGGHTEDSSLLFEGRAQPYLIGVPCVWDRPMMVSGESAGDRFESPADFRAHLAERALGLEDGAGPQQVVDRLAERCGGRPVRMASPAVRDELAEALLAAGGLEDIAALVGRGSVGGLTDLADLFDIPLEVPADDRQLDRWVRRAAFAVLQLQGLVSRDAGEAVPLPDGVGIFPKNAHHSEPLPDRVPLYWRWGAIHGSSQAVSVIPGTALERYRMGDRLLALVVVQSGGDGEADRRSAWRSWARDRSWDELARRLEIPDLERLEITRRGRSGRVVGMVAEGRSGTRKDLEGFPIRRALDLPENLFTFHVMTTEGGDRVARFLGRGWGHGVGLCQNGAYGLARSGMTFDRILKHYYTGIEITTWQDSTR